MSCFVKLLTQQQLSFFVMLCTLHLMTTRASHSYRLWLPFLEEGNQERNRLKVAIHGEKGKPAAMSCIVKLLSQLSFFVMLCTLHLMTTRTKALIQIITTIFWRRTKNKIGLSIFQLLLQAASYTFGLEQVMVWTFISNKVKTSCLGQMWCMQVGIPR